ncbi:MAG TPA: hypothetical protein DF383_03315, partial [Deltaproteobacteria bacterium]|nr:hypothetical protein [Deltaproteobacteria bacterium]
LYPRNDFFDDDYEFWKDSGRHRPFFVGTYPDYHLLYSAERPPGKASSLGKTVKGILREFTNSYNVYAYLAQFFLHSSKIVRSRPNGFSYSGFYDFTPEGWARMRYALEKIIAEASGKRITILLLPSPSDIERFLQEKKPAPLSRQMAEFGKTNGVEIVDLLPAIAQVGSDWKQYYNYPCDRHLSESGDALVARILLERLGIQVSAKSGR